MPHWGRPYKTRRSWNILSYAVNQNWELLNVSGEACILLKRMRAASENFQLDGRKVDYLEKTLVSTSIDPDTGMYRVPLWTESTDRPEDYPDIRTLTCTVQSSGSSSVWEPAVDKYSFISGRDEYAFDIYNNALDTNGADIEDAVYVVFNTPPFTHGYTARFIYGSINPYTSFEYMQPTRDNHPDFQLSLFSFQQWIKPTARVRRKIAPHQFLVAFPGTLTDISMTTGGFLRQSQTDYWTVPAGANDLSPTIVEHDIVVRVSTGQRFQVTKYTPIYVEDVLVSQHFEMTELAPESSIYNVPVATT